METLSTIILGLVYAYVIGSYIAMYFILKMDWTQDTCPLERGGALMCAPIYLSLILCCLIVRKKSN